MIELIYNPFGCFLTHVGTGNQGNRWNLITYRLALAVYTRSPAAYAALKSFNILQLPSKRSLQEFVGANCDPPGVNEKKIAEQRNLYDAVKQLKLRSNKKEPQSEGVLIFDEVKVQSKVRFPLYTCMNLHLVWLLQTCSETE